MAAISKEEYLKRYLSGDTKKKKKKVKGVKQSNVRIIDDDVDMRTISSGKSAAKESDDEAPIVADIIDERPEHVKRLEAYRKDQRWKVLGATNGQDEVAAKDYGVIASGDNNSTTAKGVPRRRHDSDNSDASPPRGRQRHDSDSDPCAPRKVRHDSGSDASPPRRKRLDSDSDDAGRPRGRKSQNEKVTTKKDVGNRQRHDSDSDNSPPRKIPKSGKSPSGRGRHDSDSDQSVPRRRGVGDQSPPRRSSKAKSGDPSPARRKRRDSGSDQSPPRKQTKSGDQSPAGRKRRDSDSDQSPPRKGKSGDSSPPRRKRRDSDNSPPRRRRDNDQSPPRRRKDNGDRAKDGERKGAKPEKTLGGAKAGLSTAAEMRKEAEKLKQKEDQIFSKIGSEALGKEAKTVFRDKSSGKRRDLAAEKEVEEEEAKRKAEEDKKYQAWGQGLKQQEMRDQTMQSYVHEASKPLARYKDDDDLDKMMREMDREGDPMAKFLQKKKKKEDPANEKPRYRGPPPPPNRFGIMPGYRWDGVDRSSGFEKQLFTKMSEKKAVKEHAYKWSVEDM